MLHKNRCARAMPVLLAGMILLISGRDAATAKVWSESDGAYPFTTLVTQGSIRAYQIMTGASRGFACPMHPHCSQYSLLGFKSHSAPMAVAMTADRLFRCGHDLRFYDRTCVDDRTRFFDPDPSNTSWRRYYAATRPIRNVAISQNSASQADDRSGGKAIPGDDEQLFRFAKDLRRREQYGDAALEFQRLMSYYPGSDLYAAASREALICLYFDGDLLGAIAWADEILEFQTTAADSAEVILMMGSAHFRLDEYGPALAHFDSVALISKKELSVKGHMLAGLSLAYGGQWDQAETRFEAIPEDSRYREYALNCKELCPVGANLRRKSPTLAGFLAIIPGLGYLYDGYPETALTAFIVNGLFIGSAYQAYHKDQPALGALLTVFGVGWYVGNIYGSVASAERRNAFHQKELLLQFSIGFSF